MAPLIFRGSVVTGSGHYSSDLRFPGRDQHLAAPPDWPETICQGSLNIRVQRYPSEFLARADPPDVTLLDRKVFSPAWVIPQAAIRGNTIGEDRPGGSDLGDAQAWRADLRHLHAEGVEHVWVVRRIGSTMRWYLELMAGVRLRDAMGLIDGSEVEVAMSVSDGMVDTSCKR